VSALAATAPAQDHRRRERVGAALCVTTATTFAASVIFAKLAFAAGANVLSVLVPRFGIAALVLWALAARRGVARVPLRDALAALALGLVLYSAETGLLFAALTRIEASLVELLVFCYPALVVLGALLLRREAPTRRRFAALALATGGVSLVLAGGGVGGSVDVLSLAMPLAAAFVYAGYVLAAETLSGRLHPLTLAALVSTGATIAFAAAGTAAGTLHLDMPEAAWAWALVLALATTVVPMGAFLAGVARIGSSRASILAMLEPPLAIVGAFLVLGDRLEPAQVAGGLLVLGAAVLVQLRTATRAPARAPG
jgi:drug/metabolite transporter (DMT)-like permease